MVLDGTEREHNTFYIIGRRFPVLLNVELRLCANEEQISESHSAQYVF